LNDDANKVMADYFQRISHPALTDVTIDWGGMQVSEVYPAKLPDLFVGRPVVITGRYGGNGGEAGVRVGGKVGGGERESIAIVLVLLSGCAAHYVTPGRGAQMEMFGAADLGKAQSPASEQARGTDGGIATILEKKPLASFPAAVAVVRVQAPGYQSHTACG